jgi:hypothetical protein
MANNIKKQRDATSQQQQKTKRTGASRSGKVASVVIHITRDIELRELTLVLTL